METMLSINKHCHMVAILMLNKSYQYSVNMVSGIVIVWLMWQTGRKRVDEMLLYYPNYSSIPS